MQCTKGGGGVGKTRELRRGMGREEGMVVRGSVREERVVGGEGREGK